MIRLLAALLGLGALALIVQGALAALLPPGLVPDLGLLLAVAAAVSAPALPALLLAAGLGYGADLLSGTLLGELALLRLLVFGATRFVSAQVHLERGLPFATFCLAVGALEPLGLAGLSLLFGGSSPFGWEALPTVASRALLLAVLSPSAHRGIDAVVLRFLDADVRRREVRFDTRRPVI